MPNHRTTVESIYQAFGRGDMPAIVDKLSPQVRWEAWHDHFAQRAGLPHLAVRHGPDGVLAFFNAIGSGYQFHEFKVLDVIGDGAQSAVEVTVDCTVRATGRRFFDEELHLWSFDEVGRVSRMRHYVDTAKHLWACAAAAPA